MKNSITFISLFIISYSLFGQTEKQIAQNISLADQYFEEAQQLDLKDTTVFELLNQALQIYETNKLQIKVIETKSYLSFRYHITNPDHDKERNTNGFELANDLVASAHASKTVINKKHLKYAYLTLVKQHYKINPEKALAYADTLPPLIKSPSEEYFYLSFWLNYAYYFKQKTNSIKELLEENKKYLEENKDEKYQRFWVYYHIGMMLYERRTNNFESAVVFGSQALLEDKQHQLLSNADKAALMVVLGTLNRNLKRYEQAIHWTEKAMKTSGLLPNNPARASYLHYLSMIYYYQENYTKAIEVEEEAIVLASTDTIEYRNHLRTLHSNISAYYEILGDLKNAKRHIESSQKYGKTHYSHEESLEESQKGIILMSTNFSDTDYVQNPPSDEVYESNYWVGKSLGDKASTWLKYAKKDSTLAYCQYALNTAKASIEVFQRGEETNLGFEQSFLSNNEDIHDIKTLIAGIYHFMDCISPSEAFKKELFDICEQIKATALLKSLAPSPLPKHLAEEEAFLNQSIQSTQQKIRTASLDSTAFYQNQLFELNQKAKSFLNRLKTENIKQTDYFYKVNYASIKEIQTELADSVAFISYSESAGGLFITTIRRNEFSTIKVFNDDAHSDNLMTFQKLIKNPLLLQKKKRKQFIDASHYLYQTLIQPIESKLVGVNKLMIVPEGNLFYIPFEALVSSNEAKPFEELDFLVKKYDINYHYSATAYKQLKARETITNEAVLAFAPVFEGNQPIGETLRSMEFAVDSIFSGTRDDSFIPLPNTEIEVNSIQDVLGNSSESQIFLKAAATEENFINALSSKQYQFVHIATHGFVNTEDPAFSALVCHKKSKTADGVLFANEIQQLDINADLVVLSSCESGIGQLFWGEGLIALNRSFVYAGAKNVLFSLWKINDQYSSELMIDFYKEVKAGKTYTAALRAAKLKMLSNPKTSSPRYWAPFVLMGE